MDLKILFSGLFLCGWVACIGQTDLSLVVTDFSERVIVVFEEKENDVFQEMFFKYEIRNLKYDHFSHIGAFCKWEIQLEKSNSFPVKFRLGSQEYVDELEMKKWTQIPAQK